MPYDQIICDNIQGNCSIVIFDITFNRQNKIKLDEVAFEFK